MRIEHTYVKKTHHWKTAFTLTLPLYTRGGKVFPWLKVGCISSCFDVGHFSFLSEKIPCFFLILHYHILRHFTLQHIKTFYITTY